MSETSESIQTEGSQSHAVVFPILDIAIAVAGEEDYPHIGIGLDKVLELAEALAGLVDNPADAEMRTHAGETLDKFGIGIEEGNLVVDFHKLGPVHLGGPELGHKIRDFILGVITEAQRRKGTGPR